MPEASKMGSVVPWLFSVGTGYLLAKNCIKGNEMCIYTYLYFPCKPFIVVARAIRLSPLGFSLLYKNAQSPCPIGIPHKLISQVSVSLDTMLTPREAVQ